MNEAFGKSTRTGSSLRLALAWGLMSTPLVAASCVEAPKDKQDVPAASGAVQVASSGDAISEAEACERLKDAYDEALDDLNCDRPELVCPDALRASAPACSDYPEGEDDGGDWSGGVGECVQRIEDYSSCSDFERPCIVPALESRDEVCLAALNPDAPDSGAADAGNAMDASTNPDSMDAGDVGGSDGGSGDAG